MAQNESTQFRMFMGIRVGGLPPADWDERTYRVADLLQLEGPAIDLARRLKRARFEDVRCERVFVDHGSEITEPIAFEEQPA